MKKALKRSLQGFLRSCTSVRGDVSIHASSGDDQIILPLVRM